MPETQEVSCVWKCGDPTPDHAHFAILVREKDGRLLGRLCPDGTTTRKNLFAAVVSRATADDVAAQINAVGDYVAKPIPF